MAAIFAARFFSSATQLSMARALATMSGNEVVPGFTCESRWGSGFRQLALFEIAKMPSPEGPAQDFESQRAALQFSGSGSLVPDAVASTKMLWPLAGLLL